MSRRQGRPWQPMMRALRIIPPALAAKAAADPRVAQIVDQVREVWSNDQYVVHVTRRATGEHAGTVEHLSIRRVDRAAAQDWRHFQRIKDEIAGPDVEAAELYPARARVVDNANQYHLWCFPPGIRFPFGFAEGSASSDTRDWGSARQRPLDGAWLAMTPGETARHGKPGQGYGTLLPAVRP
jgi:hypothetical protein